MSGGASSSSSSSLAPTTKTATTTDRSLSSTTAKRNIATIKQPSSPPIGSNLTLNINKETRSDSPQTLGQGLFRNLIQYQNNNFSMESPTDGHDREDFRHQKTIENVLTTTTSSDDLPNTTTTTARIPSTTPLAQSSPLSIIDHLLPQTDQHQLPWSTTYSLPMYSSFGVDLNYPGDEEHSSLIGMNLEQPQSSPIAFHNHPIGFGNGDSSAKILSLGSCSLINRFGGYQSMNSGNSDISSVFPSNDATTRLLGGRTARTPKYQQQRHTEDAIGSGRSYSSVLHSQQQASVQYGSRFSMFDVQHPVSKRESSNPIKGLSNQSSLTPTDNRRPTASSTLSSQFSQPQARHLSDFFSSAASHNQQPYQLVTASASPVISASQIHQPNSTAHGNFASVSASIGAGGSNGGHSQAGDGPSSFMNSSGGHFPRSSGDKPFPGSAANISNGPKRRNKLPFFTGNNSSGDGNQLRLDLYGSSLINSDGSERFSRKVFVGGLPPDIDEEEIKASFRRFGSLIVDWPHKAESKSYFPPKGYAFLLFHEESSVQALIDACIQEDDKLYLCVSSPTIKDKPVQIRPWRLSDADFVLDSTLALDPRKTVFVGGVPRPLKASELANIMNNLYGGVCYAGIDTDPELKYPKGAGRVAFSNHQSYIAAISARFVHLHHSDIEKRVEVKPYVLDDQFCDECQGAKCGNKFAPFFCANITCLRYYCDNCWSSIHSHSGREFHKPLVKEGADRPRGGPSRWS